MELSASLKLPYNNYVMDFFWANNTRVLAHIGRSDDKLSWDYHYGELFGMDADGANQKFVYGPRVGNSNLLDVLSLLPAEPEHILVSTAYDPRAVRVNIYSGDTSRVAYAPTKRSRLLTDIQGNLRYAVMTSHKFESVVHKYDPKEESWREINRIAYTSGFSEPISIDGNGTAYIRESFDEGPIGIYIVDLESGKRTLLYRHEKVDAYLLQDHKRHPWGVRIWPGKPEVVILDPEHPFSQLTLSLQTSFPNSRIDIANSTDDFSYIVASVSQDIAPAKYFLFNRADKTLQALFSSRPWLAEEALKPNKLSPMHPHSFKARDGLELDLLLTLPTNVQEQKNLPTVIFPHGGPYGIDDFWRFDRDVQAMASRGYAVVQVNFRGSGGRGPHFESLGIGEWGDKLQDDVTDATHWAIEQGYADPERICIYGWSHGGYAALRGVVKEPNLYKCAIGAAGVYDFKIQRRLSDTSRYDSGRAYLKQTIGRDKQKIRRISPVHHADKINAAVFLVHGTKDARVPVKNARAMRRALRKAGKEPRYLELKGERHGIGSPAKWVEFYQQVFAFLDENIGS